MGFKQMTWLWLSLAEAETEKTPGKLGNLRSKVPDNFHFERGKLGNLRSKKVPNNFHFEGGFLVNQEQGKLWIFNTKSSPQASCGDY